MPYIITTIPAPGAFHDDGSPVFETRTAVATLDEARDRIVAAVAGTSKRQPVLDDARWTYADSLPESGGTIGPLPDGTVVEVERVDRFALGFSAGLIAADHPQLWADADLVAKFNRTGRFSADPA